MSTNYIGKPENRVDGKLKVTGEAKYAAEFIAPDLAHGYVVTSEIAKGRITKVHAERALSVPGVIEVFTHENRPHEPWFDSSYKDDDAPAGSPFRPLYDENILYNQQPIALVVAEDFETAGYAASLVEFEYEVEPHETDLDEKREEAYTPPKDSGAYTPPPGPRGNPDRAFSEADVQFEAEYAQPIEHHNPMEMHATTVLYKPDETLVVYDKTQGVQNNQKYLMSVFGLSKDELRVVSPFVGGGFGSGLRPQYQSFLAVMATLALKRSVRVVLTRRQMFTFGHRPNTLQNVSLSADRDGKLEALIHKALAETSPFEDYAENVLAWSGSLYDCDNVKLEHKIAKLDFYTPISMRAPGGVTGVYALESALDELAYKLKIDPVELRLKNYSTIDKNTGKPFSSKELRACYSQAAEKFGWERRNPEPRSMRDSKELVGWGMATGVWDSKQKKAGARAVLNGDGKLEVTSATSDIGTGTYTIMTQIAAETLGLPIENVTFRLGDSSMPQAPLEGGSWTASTVGSAVKEVCQKVGAKLLALAQNINDSPFADAELKDVSFENGFIKLNADESVKIAMTDLMRRGETTRIEEEITSKPNSEKQDQFISQTHSAVFVEVKVDEELGVIRVTRVASAIAGGRILNPKTARSQILGAVVWGIGMALEEESVVDQNFGRFVNHNLAEYHIPVNADVPEIDVIFVEEHDSIVNPLGAKGLGEIGIIGVAAAIGNAIYHAIGKRVRDLPFTLDKLL